MGFLELGIYVYIHIYIYIYIHTHTHIIVTGLILDHMHGFQARASPVPRPTGGGAETKGQDLGRKRGTPLERGSQPRLGQHPKFTALPSTWHLQGG